MHGLWMKISIGISGSLQYLLTLAVKQILISFLKVVVEMKTKCTNSDSCRDKNPYTKLHTQTFCAAINSFSMETYPTMCTMRMM